MYDDYDVDDLLGFADGGGDELLGLIEQGYSGDDLLGMGYDADDLLGFGLSDIGRGLRGIGRAVGRGAGAVLPGAIGGALGLTRRRPRRVRRPARRMISTRRMAPTVYAKPPLMSPAPGVPQNSALYIPLGFPSFNFVNAGVTTNNFQANPQKPVRPRRLWINAARSAGAGGIGVVVSDIKIGTRSMLAGVDPIPIEQFAAGAFANTYSMFDGATPGVFVSVDIALSATPPVGENIFISMSMDCNSLG